MTATAIRLTCACSGPIAVVAVGGALACGRCSAPIVAGSPTNDEAVDLRNVGGSYDQLRRRAAKGEIPGAHRLGRRWVIRRSDWDAFLEAEHTRQRGAVRRVGADTSTDPDAEIRARLGLRLAGGAQR